MGVSLYPMDQTCEADFGMSYSTLQKLRQLVILVVIKYLEFELEAHGTRESSESKHKKIKISSEQNEDEFEKVPNEEGENDENKQQVEDEEDEDEEDREEVVMLKYALESIKTWCVPEQPKPLFYDSTKHSLIDLVGQLNQMIPIKYDKINATLRIGGGGKLENILIKLGLIGLPKFVNHSDCGGYHSVGDCVDIHETLQKGLKHVESLQNEDDVAFYQECTEFFRQIVESKTGVCYS